MHCSYATVRFFFSNGKFKSFETFIVLNAKKCGCSVVPHLFMKKLLEPGNFFCSSYNLPWKWPEKLIPRFTALGLSNEFVC